MAPQAKAISKVCFHCFLDENLYLVVIFFQTYSGYPMASIWYARIARDVTEAQRKIGKPKKSGCKEISKIYIQFLRNIYHSSSSRTSPILN